MDTVFFEEAKKGDMICNRAIDQMIEILGKGIANICYVINPEVVVLGGGIMAQEEFLRGKIQDAVKKYLISSIEEHTKIVFAKHQNDAGILGAFYHFCGVNKKVIRYKNIIRNNCQQLTYPKRAV